MRRDRIVSALLLVALAGCALLVARLVATVGGGVELSRAHVSRVDADLARRLAQGELDLLVQWFGPAPGAAPSAYRDVGARVETAFEALRAAGGAQVRTQVLRPDADAEARRHAEALGLAPFRARRVVRDGWAEAPVWSALRVVVGGRGAVVVRALTPELADGVQDLVAAAVREVEAPRRPLVLLFAPPGHAGLRERLRARADVRDVEFDDDARIDADADLLVWIPAREPDDRHVRAIEQFVQRGGSVCLATSRFEGRVEGSDLVVDDRGVKADALLARLGAPADDAPLLEAPLPDAAERAANWTWHVPRSIGSRQDFRALGSQPNGTLAFRTPAALRPDLARLAERAATFTSLATSSERVSTLAAGPSRTPLARLADGSAGFAEPPRTLIALLVPLDPTHGSIVVAASASPFADPAIAESGLAHGELVDVLVAGLASTERRVLAAVARGRPEPLPEASAGLRVAARIVGVLLVPGVLFVLAIARGTFRASLGSARSLSSLGLALGALLVVGLAARGIGKEPGVDAARLGSAALPPELLAIARDAAREPVVIRTAFSAPDELPPELRPAARALASRCAELARRVDGVEFREASPDDPALADARLRRITRTSERDESRATSAFHASLVIERGGARRVLEFPDERAFDHRDFRLALALRDLARGARAAVDVQSEPPRVTPAEARAHYQTKGLFVPGGGDPFAAARALLATNGFDVAALDDARSGGGDGRAGALLLWLQPRRDASAGIERLRRRLAAGGSAIVCVQQHRVRPRLREDEPGEATLWPEPLFPDIDRGWLPESGARLAAELVLDASSGVARVRGTRTTRAGLEAIEMDLASPLVVRATPADRPRTPFTHGVGDLVLTSPARIELDAARLRAAGLTAEVVLTTSPRAWTHLWSGGRVPDEALAPRTGTLDPLPLAVRLAGMFDAGATTPGSLLLVGASEPFTDDHLFDPHADHARFLLQACAASLLEPEFAALLARAPTVGGYRVLEPNERLRARVATLLAGPLLVLVAAFAWRRARARSAVHAAEAAA